MLLRAIVKSNDDKLNYLFIKGYFQYIHVIKAWENMGQQVTLSPQSYKKLPILLLHFHFFCFDL